jgi:hypothetical protein
VGQVVGLAGEMGGCQSGDEDDEDDEDKQEWGKWDWMAHCCP